MSDTKIIKDAWPRRGLTKYLVNRRELERLLIGYKSAIEFYDDGKLVQIRVKEK